MELKTNEDGKATIDVIPIGDTVRLQVIADGFQTYGQDFKVDKLDIPMEVRLKRPAHQFSLYPNSTANSGSGASSGTGSSSGSNSGSGNSSGSGKSSNPAPPASGDKPSGSSGQSSDQPNPNPPKNN